MADQSKIYDLIIIGAGPAGLTAGIYASRYNLANLIISEDIGGMAQEAWHVENYPGIAKTTGLDLTQAMANQAKSLGSEILVAGVNEIIPQPDRSWLVKTDSTHEFKAKTIILALGLKSRQLNIPGEAEFLGKGVSYCFTCDGIFFRDKIVGVVGGGNAAAHAALTLAQYAQKIYILAQEPTMSSEPALIQELEKNPKIEILLNAKLKALQGTNSLETVTLQINNQEKQLAMAGLFVEIGAAPSAILAKQIGVNLDDKNHIRVNSAQETNVPSVFAAGSITNASPMLNQIVISCGQGALAAFSANLYLKKPSTAS